MNLIDYTIKVKHYSKNIVNNFIDIGKLLKEIRDKEIFKENYNCFTEYLEKEQSNLSKGFVSKLIRVVEDDKLVSTSKLLGICKTMELIYVPNREIRDEIVKKAIKEEMTTQDIRAEGSKARPDKPPRLNTEEEVYYKLLNDGDRLRNEMALILTSLNDFLDRYHVWKKKASKNQDIVPKIEQIEGIISQIKKKD